MMRHMGGALLLRADQSGLDKGLEKADNTEWTRGMTVAENRTLLENVLLHAVIRIKYWLQAWFGLKPIFGYISGYHSFLRPKGMPKPRLLDLFILKMLWFVGAVIKYNRVSLYIAVKLRILHTMNGIHKWVMVRF